MRQIILYVIFLFFISLSGKAQNKPALGRADAYMVLAGTGVNNSGNTRIEGNLGVAPGTGITGFPPGQVTGRIDRNLTAAANAQTDLTLAYDQARTRTTTVNLSGQPLGGRTLTPGVYKFDTNAALSGNLILDNGGNADAVFIFQIGADFTVNNNAIISFPSATPPRVNNIFWQVTNNVFIGENSAIKGSVLANQNITVGNAASIQGRLLARNGTVSLTNNNITLPMATDLEITQTISAGIRKAGLYSIGDEVTFTITAKNLGPVDNTNVRIDHRLGAGLDFISASVLGSSYNASTGKRTWTLPNFANGATQTIQIVAKINNNASVRVESQAEIAGDKVDEIQGNNTNSVYACVMPVNPGVITGLDAVCANQGNYTFSVVPIAGAAVYDWEIPKTEGWSITSEENSPTIRVTAGKDPGNITVKVYNNCAETLASTKSISVSTTPSPAPGPITPNNGTNNPCVGNTTVTYTIDPVIGANSYRWEKPTDWVITAGQGTPSITVKVGSAAGNVKVFAVNGCGDSDPSILAVVPSGARPDQAIAINGSANPCIDESNTYSVNPVPGATSYRWIIPAGFAILSEQGKDFITVKPSTSATATIGVEAINGCGITSVSIIVNPVGKVKPGRITGPVRPCINTPNTYSIAPVPGAIAYLWSVPGLSSVPGDRSTAITFVPTSSMTSSMTIKVQAQFICGYSSEEAFNITPINKPAQPAPIISNKQQVCNGNEVTLTIPLVVGATSYEWKVVSGNSVIKTGQNTTAITVTAGSTESTIEVVAINECGRSVARALMLQPLLSPPAQPLTITGPVSLCVSPATITYSVAAVPNATDYTWSVPNDPTWKILSGQGTTSIEVKVGTAGGNISVTANNDCGSSVIKTLAVTPSTAVPPTPGPISSSQVQPCINNSELVTYSVSAIAGITTYTWALTEDNGWQIVSGQGTTSIKVKVGTVARTISVSAVNSCGSGIPVTLEVIPTASLPGVLGKVSGPLLPCTNQSELVTYSVSAIAGITTYTWALTEDNGWQIVSGQGTTSIKVKVGTVARTISVSAVNSCGSGPVQSLTVTPGAGRPQKPGPITGNTSLCVGQSNLTFSVPAGNNIESYEWKLPVGWSMVSGKDSNSIVVSVGSGAGNIEVVAKNGCGPSEASLLAVSPTAEPPANPEAIQASKPVFCAGTTSLAYSVPPVRLASTYTWTVPEGWTITSGNGTNSILVTAGSTSGNILLMVYNNCGAASASLAVAPNVKPAEPGNITGNSIPCARSTGNNYRIDNVPGANRYEWEVPNGWKITAGANTTAITLEAGAEAGNITVTAFNDCGNTTATLAVTPATGAPESIGAISGNKSICAGNTEILSYSVAAVANASEYIWTLPVGWEIISGQGAAAIKVKSNNNSGTISATIKNGCGIGATSSMFVQVSGQVPPQPGGITGNTQVCAANEIRYSIGEVSGATGYAWEVPAGWVITAGQGTTSIKVTTGNTSGNVSVKAVNGCSHSLEASSLAVAITAKPETPVVIAGDEDQCAGNTGKVYSTDAVTGATTYIWTVPADWVITAGQGTTAITITAGSASGNVTVAARNDCGHSEARILAVTSASTPSPAPARILASNNLICSEQDSLIYTIDPVATATSYAWTVPEGWTILEGQGQTSIKVRAGTAAGNIGVKALNGCGESNARLLPVDPTATAAISIGTITGETTSCSGQAAVTYSVAAVPGATNYTWIIPQDWIITTGQGTNSIKVTIGLTSGNVSVAAVSTCTTSLTSTLAVKVNPSPTALSPIQDKGSPCTGLMYAVDAVDGATGYTWTVPAGWVITDGQGTPSIKVTAPAGSQKNLVSVAAQTTTCNTAPVSLEANPARGDIDLTIANVFSPNGDGVNDKWEVVNIQNYAENDLVIINRWGSEVYRSKAYRNQWDGGELSAGTYFYVLKIKVCDGSYKTHKGYVMIMK